MPNDLVRLPPEFLMYAFRYALGRMSYAVGDVADALVDNIGKLRPDWRSQIIRDIEAAVACGRAGMQMDVERWRQVAAAMAKSLDS